MDRLTEIRTKIECYQDFLEDLEEITSALETNTGLGLFLQAESQECVYSEKLASLLNNHVALSWIKRDGHKDDYIGILLLLWAKANAKMGEIAFLLEESIEQLQNEEDEILSNMEQSGTRHETHANLVYADTDSVIDGRDKTLCMYDVYEKAMGFKRPVLHCDKDGNTWINSQE